MRRAALALLALAAACDSHRGSTRTAPSATPPAAVASTTEAPARSSANPSPCASCGPAVVAACGHDVRITESTLQRDPDLDAGVVQGFTTSSWVAVTRFADLALEGGASDADARRAYCVQRGADVCGERAAWELDGPTDRGHAPVTYVAPIEHGLLVATGSLKGGDCASDGSFYTSRATLASGVLVVQAEVEAFEQPACKKRLRHYESTTFYDPRSGHVVAVQGATAALQGRAVVTPGCPRIDLDAPILRR